MKKFVLTIFFIMIFLTACGEKNEISTETTGNVLTESSAPDTASSNTLTDFSDVMIEDYIIVNVGDTAENPYKTEVVSSNTDAVSMDSGEIKAVSPGVAIITANGKEGTAVCVLPEGKTENHGAGKAKICRVGDSFTVETPVIDPTFSSSDENVIKLEGNRAACVGEGYAVVTAASASVPQMYAYIVVNK